MTEMDRAHRELAAMLFGDMSRQALGAFVTGLTEVTSRLRARMQAPQPGSG
jgi:hypothetical protein